MSPIEAVFDQQGGTLGRSPSNHLVLMDNERVVSGEHATITYENRRYYYIDTSLNGTRITNRNQRIHHEKICLKDDDKLQVGEYHLVLSFSEPAARRRSDDAEPVQDPWSLSMFDQDASKSRASQRSDMLGGNGFSNPDQKISDDETRKGPFAFSTDWAASIGDSFVPPEPIRGEPKGNNSPLPDDLTLDDFFDSDVGSRLTTVDANGYNLPIHGDERHQDRLIFRKEGHADFDELLETSAFTGKEAAHKPFVPSASEQPSVGANHSRSNLKERLAEPLREFFNAAGLEQGGNYSPEQCLSLMRSVGSILRELVDGLMTVLRGRSELKSQLRVSMTTLKPVENNPFKFSPTVEEALKICLLNNHPGFLDAVDAVHEGYEDIKNHQLAITAGIQASLDSILKQFEPQRFADKFKEGLVLHKKAKCWDEFRQAYQPIVEQALENFFGEVFVRAYEAQIDKLRTRKK